MSTNCNGANSKAPKLSKECVGSFEKPVSLDNNSSENSADEANFKGFEKTPVVLLLRTDITSYLKHKGSPYCSKSLYSDLSIHQNRLSSSCVVKLIRGDLETLKNAIKLKEAPSEDSESSDLDADFDITMASKCNICEKLYASEKKLLKHQSKKHMIVYEHKPQKRVSFSDHVIIHELKEYHKCRKCTKIFEDYKTLKIHMKQHHKKRKCYICNYCNRTFVDRIFFKVHIKSHCDLCGELFYSRAIYHEHRRTVCRTFKLHKCKDCELSFFKLMDLKDHGYEHIGIALVCDVCKDQFHTKCALAHHISFLHSKRRPSCMYVMRNLGTERLYLCNFCEESSVDKDLIEIHLQSLPDLTNKAMTGYKDYYFCDQCMKKFPTEKDMLQHKWTHFLKTSDNSQTRMEHENETSDSQSITFKLGDKLPDSMSPILVLEKMNILDGSGNRIDKVDLNTFHLKNRSVDSKPGPRSKKNKSYNFKCQTCGKHYSSNYCLNRHIETQHRDYVNLRCHVCKESFIWPSMMENHKCVNHSERAQDSATPEIYFDNINNFTQNGLDDFNIVESDDYLNTVDFEIPAPIVEFSDGFAANNYEGMNGNLMPMDKTCVLPLENLTTKIIIQEVPIEF